MKALKFLTVLLALTLAASTAVSAVPGKIGGSTNVVTKEIKLPNGTNTGVTLTEMTIPKYTFYNPSTKNDKKACHLGRKFFVAYIYLVRGSLS